MHILPFRWLAKKPARKIFGIGFNKTGTTSLAGALEQLGYRVAPQGPIVGLFEPIYLQRQYRYLSEFCRRYDAFQDIPFSLPGVFRELDRLFPGSKFILTVRNNADEWFDSLLRFTIKLYPHRNGQPPSLADMQTHPVGTDFIPFKMHRLVFEAETQGLWHREHYKAVYERHCDDARRFFRQRPQDFCELNVGAVGAHAQLCSFLGHESQQSQMPHLNRSAG
jgi:hypothetical protein